MIKPELLNLPLTCSWEKAWGLRIHITSPKSRGIHKSIILASWLVFFSYNEETSPFNRSFYLFFFVPRPRNNNYGEIRRLYVRRNEEGGFPRRYGKPWGRTGTIRRKLGNYGKGDTQNKLSTFPVKSLTFSVCILLKQSRGCFLVL